MSEHHRDAARVAQPVPSRWPTDASRSCGTPESLNDRNRRIGALLRHRRRELRLSLEWVGEQLSISQQLLSTYERGRVTISAMVLWKLAKVLDADIDSFFEA